MGKQNTQLYKAERIKGFKIFLAVITQQERIPRFSKI